MTSGVHDPRFSDRGRRRARDGSELDDSIEPATPASEKRKEEGREATAVAYRGATLLMMAWKPGRRGPLPRGASPEEIEAAFPEWTLVDDEAMEMPSGVPGYVRRAEPRFYSLCRA